MTEYNPLDYPNLVRSCVIELMSQEATNLADVQPFQGAGIYALYYTGKFDLYKSISPDMPIYIGKAVWEGGRKGVKLQKIANKISRMNPQGGPLYRRLKEHVKSIQHAANLDINDFKCRYLVVHHVWITQLETMLINRYEPLWNQCLEGFGLHDPGSTRYSGKLSWWDTLHPGRPWVKKMPLRRTQEEVYEKVQEFRRFMSQHCSIKTKEQIVRI